MEALCLSHSVKACLGLSSYPDWDRLLGLLEQQLLQETTLSLG